MANFTERYIREFFEDYIFDRGKKYWEQGAVISLEEEDNYIHSTVKGSYLYKVSICIEDNEIESIKCSCPYDDNCKHAAATLLAYLHMDKKPIQETTNLEELLKDLTPAQLKNIILTILKKQPNFINQVELLVAQSNPSAKIVKLNKAILRRRAKDKSEMPLLLDEINQLLETKQTQTAFDVLNIITPEYVSYCLNFIENQYNGYYEGYDGEVVDELYFDELGESWVRVLLLLDKVNNTLKKTLLEQFKEWNNSLSECMGNDPFETAQLALKYNWEFKPLQRVLAGDSTTSPWESTDDEDDCNAYSLTKYYLEILEKQQRYDQYLRLAFATEDWVEYAQMLIKLNQIKEALETGITCFYKPNQFLEVAKTLYENKHQESALQLAEQGLKTIRVNQPFGVNCDLADWLNQTALALGKREIALNASVILCKGKPSLNIYLHTKQLAGEQWQSLHKQLIAYYTDQTLSDDLIDILVEEQAFDILANLVEKYTVGEGISLGTRDLVLKAFEALLQTHPRLLVKLAPNLAEKAIARTKTEHYIAAAQYLKQLKAAYQILNQPAKWDNYYQQLYQTHIKKRRLIEILNGTFK